LPPRAPPPVQLPVERSYSFALGVTIWLMTAMHITATALLLGS